MKETEILLLSVATGNSDVDVDVELSGWISDEENVSLPRSTSMRTGGVVLFQRRIEAVLTTGLTLLSTSAAGWGCWMKGSEGTTAAMLLPVTLRSVVSSLISVDPLPFSNVN